MEVARCDGELELGVRSMAVPVPVPVRACQVTAAMSIAVRAVRAERMALAEVRETFLPALRKASSSLVTRLNAV